MLYHEKLSIICLSLGRDETPRLTSHEIFLQAFDNFFQQYIKSYESLVGESVLLQ